jgi:peptidoglycan/xylan/chitin deacetylase (PgdA/CDA1 family)
MSVPIFVIHRVAPRHNDRWGLTLDPEEFERLITELTDSATLVPLEEALQTTPFNVQARNLLRPCAITFDDAYDDLPRYAFPVLQRFQAPATLFVPTHYVASGNPFWWEALRWLEQQPRELNRIATTWGWKTQEGTAETIDHWCTRLKMMAPAQRDQHIDEIRLPGTMEGKCAMSSEVLCTIPEVVRVESHGHSHTILSVLTEGQLCAELQRSQDLLETWTGQRPCLFAYPNGQPHDFTQNHAHILAGAGLHHALTTVARSIPGYPAAYVVPRTVLTPGRVLKQVREILAV